MGKREYETGNISIRLYEDLMSAKEKLKEYETDLKEERELIYRISSNLEDIGIYADPHTLGLKNEQNLLDWIESKK